MVLALINTVFAQETQEAAIAQWRAVADQLRERIRGINRSSVPTGSRTAALKPPPVKKFKDPGIGKSEHLPIPKARTCLK